MFVDSRSLSSFNPRVFDEEHWPKCEKYLYFDEDELVVDIVREGRFAPEVLEHLKGVELLEDENASYTDVIASFGPPGEEEANNRFTIRLAGVNGFSLEQIHLMDAGFGGIEGIADADRFSGVMGSQEVGSGEQRYVVITDAEIDSSGLPSSPIAFIGPGDQSLDVDLSSDENSSLVHMGAGADSVNVVSGEGTIFGGEGNDTLNSSLSSGAVLLNGGRGNDIAILRMGHQFRGGEGNDDVDETSAGLNGNININKKNTKYVMSLSIFVIIGGIIEIFMNSKSIFAFLLAVPIDGVTNL